jgi:HTH-type transcriptional regulator/antitoxin HigA
MTELNSPFSPDWVSPPGESILDLAEERGWKQSELADRVGYTEKHMSQLINGKVALTVDAAIRLERVLGSSADFWLKREANYQHHKARLDEAALHESWIPWLTSLPIKELMACGAITKQRITEKNKANIVDSCLRFFGVASPDNWKKHYGEMELSFRRSKEEQCDVGAISSWLRLGEQHAEKIDVPKFDKNRFEKAIPKIRELTEKSPEEFEPILRKILNTSGVTLVLVPSIPRAHVSGVARWLSPSRPLIQLSTYGKTNDKFWFTFFHEAAHILLHSGTAIEKKSVFLDDPNAAHSDSPQEKEANQWAGDILIPKQFSSNLSTLKTQDEIIAFAQEIRTHPGVVVGRLQHDQLIGYATKLNSLKESFHLK